MQNMHTNTLRLSESLTAIRFYEQNVIDLARATADEISETISELREYRVRISTTDAELAATRDLCHRELAEYYAVTESARYHREDQLSLSSVAPGPFL